MAAAVALVGMVVAVVGLLLFLLADFGVLVVAVICFGIGVPAAWAALTSRRFGWLLWIAAAVFLLLAVLLVVWAGDWMIWLAAIIVTLAGGIALRWEVAPALARRWRVVPPARRPVLLTIAGPPPPWFCRPEVLEIETLERQNARQPRGDVRCRRRPSFDGDEVSL